MSDAVTVILVLVAGFFTGVLSGMFGVGGAVISTPAILALGATPLQAVGSTLPSIIPGALSGSLRYAREGLVLRRVVLITGLAGAAFATAGAIASDVVPGKGHVQMVLTAGLMGFTAYRTVRMVDPAVLDHEVEVGDADGPPVPPHPHGPRPAVVPVGPLLVTGVMAGVLSGFLGVGGGIVMVPAFSSWLGLPLKQAIATSLACVGIIVIPGTVAHQVLGNIDWFFALPLIVGAIPGARVGAHLAIRASDRHLRIIVASVLGTIAVVYGTFELLRLIG